MTVMVLVGYYSEVGRVGSIVRDVLVHVDDIEDAMIASHLLYDAGCFRVVQLLPPDEPKRIFAQPTREKWSPELR